MTQVDSAQALGRPLDPEPVSGPGQVASITTLPPADRLRAVWLPAPRALVLDGRGKIAHFMGMEGGRAMLRPVCGGREYEAQPEALSPVDDPLHRAEQFMGLRA